MKRRIFSVALALCLCISSQTVAHASQAIPLPKEEGDVLPGENTDADTDIPGTGDDVDGAPETPVLPEEEGDVLPGENTDADTEAPGISDDVDGAPEAPALPEEEGGVLPGENTDADTKEPGISDDLNGAPEVPALPEEGDVLPEETGISGDAADVSQEALMQQKKAFTAEPAEESAAREGEVPSPQEVNRILIGLKEQDKYKEGTPWTNDEPYSDQKGYYRWKGGTLDGVNIVAVGCVAFAFELSDKAFGSLPARKYAAGSFSFEDIKAGDILQVNNDAHTVIVLEANEAGVVVAEGNYNSQVHWGRMMSEDEVLRTASHYITRYPAGYVPPEDPDADVSIGSGTLDGGLVWNLTTAGTLTISGTGAMPDFGGVGEQPWNGNAGKIRKVVIGEGVTGIGSCAFRECGLFSVEISSGVTTIGSNAFRASSIVSVTIPSGVKTIGESAFQECQNLSSVTVNEGVETIGQNAFRSCTSLTSIALPGSVVEVGAAAFLQCTAMDSVTFASGGKQVKMGDNLFSQCYYLRKAVLPESIDRIGAGMFQNCLMLAGVEIPQGVETIGDSAFASCSAFTTVIIPASVTTIERAAFKNCPLADIYFTGTEAQWNGIWKDSDTTSDLSQAAIHYDYTPDTNPDPGGDEDDGTENNPGDGDNTGGDAETPGGDQPGNQPGETPGGDKPGNQPGETPGGDKPGNQPGETPGGNNPGNTPGGNKPGSSSGSHTDSDSGNGESGLMASSLINSGMGAVIETWKPTTPDEIKRYSCMGKEAVRCTVSKDNDYPIEIENAMQGPMCFKSFEAVLGDYTIGRTYNIYPLTNARYSMDKEVELTIQIPSDLYKEGRQYKMICVTEGGKPYVYNDSDNSPGTITIKTDKFHAYALIYK